MDPDRSSVVYAFKRRLRKGHSEDAFQHLMTIGGYSALAAVLMFVLHLIMARMLGPNQYAAYGTYTAILFTVLFALTSIHLVITRFIAYHRTRYQYEQINYIIAQSMKMLFAKGFVVFLVVLIFARQISEFFQIDDATTTVLLGFALWFTLLVPAFEGAFKGLENYRAMGILRLIEAIGRLVVGVFLVWLGFSVGGAVLGLGLGTFAGLALSYKHLHQLQRLKVVKPNIEQIRRFAFPVLLAMISIALLLNIDIIMVKHYFPAAEAGVFAAASLIAKAPFLIGMLLVGVLFPKVTKLHADGKNSAPILKNALQMISTLALLFTILAFFFATPLFNLLFGGAYNIGPMLGFYVFGMGCLAITLVLTAYLLGVRQDKVAYVLPVFFLALLFLLTWMHTSLLQVMIVVMLVMALLAAYAFYHARNVLEFDYFL